HALGQEQGGDQVAFLPLAEGADRGVVARPFGAAVPGVVVVGAVAIALAVGVVVLVVVADQVAERETVVASDKVDAGVGSLAGPLIEVAAARQAGGEFVGGAAVPLPEATNVVAVFAVPFRPQHGKIADLIAARTDVPGLGDQLHLGQD